jgi:hypothetical protein
MVPMAANDDAWIADVASFVRSSFGNNAGFVTPAQVAEVRKTMGARRTPWTVAELLPTVPTALTNAAAWTLTASHNAAAAVNASGATPGARWDSGAPQAPGMWLQIELPQVTTISEVQFDAAAPQGLFGRGRGAGAAGAGAPARGASPANAATPAGAPPAGAPPPGAPPPAGGPPAGPAGLAAGGGRGRGALPPASGPIGFSLQVSMDGSTWGAPLVQGKGAPTTVMPFKPTPAKFIRVTQTGTPTGREFWAVAQIRVYQAGR